MPQSATYGKKRRRCLLEGAFTCGLWSPQAQLVANGEVVRAQAVTHDDLILLVELIIVESEFPTQPQQGWAPPSGYAQPTSTCVSSAWAANSGTRLSTHPSPTLGKTDPLDRVEGNHA